MEEIVHTCRKHGGLTRQEVNIMHYRYRSNRIYYRCKQCSKTNRKNTYSTSHKEWVNKNKKKLNEKSRIANLKSCKNLSDSYVRKLIHRSEHIPTKKIEKKFIDLKRTSMLLNTELGKLSGNPKKYDLRRNSSVSLPFEFLEARALESKGNPEIELKYTQEIADLIQEEYEKLLLTISATPE